MRNQIIIILSLSFSVISFADKNFCPNTLLDRSNAPTCPTSGLLPETYPVGALVVSDSAASAPPSYKYSGYDPQFTSDVTIKTLKASYPNFPAIVLMVTDQTFAYLTKAIKEDPALTPEQVKLFLATLKRGSNVSSYTWQQDYMQSFVNPKTGETFLRRVAGYDEEQNTTDGVPIVAEQLKSCGVTMKNDLTNKGFRIESKPANGYMGGNIEALPGDVCLLGTDNLKDYWEGYSKQTCPNTPEADRLAIDTSWLHVGHTDEIIKTIRNKKKQAPCDFSIAVASPAKAKELLKENPQDLFADFSGGIDANESVEARAERRYTKYHGLNSLCRYVKERRRERVVNPGSPKSEPPKSEGQGKTVTQLIKLFLTRNQAFANQPGRAPIDEECTTITNEEVYDLLENSVTFGKYNELIQERMNKVKTQISEKMASKFPSCKIDIVELPDIFIGGMPIKNKDGVYELPKPVGVSVLPNPTNAITINDTIISPEPGNASFKRYISEQYILNGLKADYVDTFDYAHMLGGNLHCATNVIYTCKGTGK